MALEIRLVTPEWQLPIAEFFSAIRRSGAEHFHPHPFTDEFADTLAHYSGNDLFYLLVAGKAVLAYGMLRGWDEAYEVPSLGIAVHPEARGMKLSELFMRFLHAAARQRNANQIRIKVYKSNAAARHLYTKLGYRFSPIEEDGQLIGTLDL